MNDLSPGNTFPALELPDHTDVPRTLRERAEVDPVVLPFLRGWWCTHRAPSFLLLPASTGPAGSAASGAAGSGFPARKRRAARACRVAVMIAKTKMASGSSKNRPSPRSREPGPILIC